MVLFISPFIGHSWSGLYLSTAIDDALPSCNDLTSTIAGILAQHSPEQEQKQQQIYA